MKNVAGWNPLCRQEAMTSACPSSNVRNRQFLRFPTVPFLFGVVFVALMGGCRYQKPVDLNSPWLPRQQVWAVAPLANESGVSAVDRLAVSDALVLETASIDGVDVLPLNRTLEAMTALQIGLNGIPTNEEFQVLIQELGVDAILVGTVIAYDPYQPLRFGASIQLIEASGRVSQAFDPRSLTMAVSERGVQTGLAGPSPLVQASGIFDAENHGVLMSLERYAAGRSTHELARSGVGLYLLDMDEFSEFVFHELLDRLLSQAQAHLGSDPAGSMASGTP